MLANKPQEPTIAAAAIAAQRQRRWVAMATPVDERVQEFTDRLRQARIHYSVSSVRDGYTMVSLAVPGERWEVEFSDSGDVEVEVFKSDGSIRGPEALARLFLDHDDAT